LILLITSSWNRNTAPQFLLFLLSSFVHSFTPSIFYKCTMRTWSLRRGQSVVVRQDSWRYNILERFLEDNNLRRTKDSSSTISHPCWYRRIFFHFSFSF
jgi:hypothetical protein